MFQNLNYRNLQLHSSFKLKLNSFPSLEEYTTPKITTIFNMILYRSDCRRGKITGNNKPVARVAISGMERYLRDATYVDPDCWQDPAQTHSASESLVERHFVCNTSWTYDICYPIR